MTITRVINGQEVQIELTTSEMFQLFDETQENFDMQDLERVLDEECIYLSADEKKKAVDKYQDAIMQEWYETMLSAIQNVINERDPAEEAYEQWLIAKSDITEPENDPAE